MTSPKGWAKQAGASRRVLLVLGLGVAGLSLLFLLAVLVLTAWRVGALPSQSTTETATQLQGIIAAVNLVLVVVLAATTVYYAIQNKRMADEMRSAREFTVHPRIALDLPFLGPFYVLVRVVNVGLGPAFDVRLRLVFEATPASGRPTTEREWRTPLLAPGHHQDFDVSGPGGVPVTFTDLPKEFSRIRLIGTMSDGLGNSSSIDETMSDLADWVQRINSAEALLPIDHLEKAADSLEEIKRTVKSWSAISGGLRVRTDQDLAREMENARRRRDEMVEQDRPGTGQ
ncbi:MAG TPA: hypothetical protein VNA57_04345 [Acidimicrobiales bacterium]|nr:hypothetical protein [Acidimicrobiales bacterium]